MGENGAEPRGVFQVCGAVAGTKDESERVSE